MLKGLLFDVTDGTKEFTVCCLCGAMFEPLKTKTCGVLETYGPNKEFGFCKDCVKIIVKLINKNKRKTDGKKKS